MDNFKSFEIQIQMSKLQKLYEKHLRYRNFDIFFESNLPKKNPLILFVSRKSRRRLNHLYRRHVN